MQADFSDQQIAQAALNTLSIEKAALAGLMQEGINADFITCVRLIHASTGRVVVTGIGKSAIIAQKIVATFNSTGTPALFMHAADAIHGDLGMVRPDDVAICISKSGGTPEVKVLAPLLKNLAQTLVGMVANADSFLAKQADLVLYTPISQEADPNNLAPTASTIVQMAMGDALATALLSLRGFTHQDFARYHPGGALGKQLYLRVSDIYPQNERPAVARGDGLRNVIIEMTSKRLGITAVLGNDNTLLGIITDGDLRRMLTTQDALTHLTAEDIMTRQPKTIEPQTLAVHALGIMRAHSISQLVVVEEKKYLGIIHLHDLVREGIL